jgi:hypothetical protein
VGAHVQGMERTGGPRRATGVTCGKDGFQRALVRERPGEGAASGRGPWARTPRGATLARGGAGRRAAQHSGAMERGRRHGPPDFFRTGTV